MSNLQLSENVNYLPPDKFKEILDYVSNNIKNKKLDNIDIQMIFRIAYYGGLRINEVLKLRKKDFDFTRLTIALGDTKTKDNDFTSFPENFAPMLKDYLEIERKGIGKEDLLFYISRQTAYIWIMDIGKALNITAWTTPQKQSHEKTKTHLFRKSIGKDMHYAGAPDSVVMTMLRHNNLETTTKYLRLNRKDVQRWTSEHQKEII